jgi:hypothetical protein
MRKLLFLTGIGRSGTTLLQQMLHAHSQIDFKPETHYFKSYILPLLLGKEKSLEVYSERSSSDSYLERLTPEDAKKLINIGGSEDSLIAGFKNLLCNNKVEFGADKDTEYVRYFPHLKKAYPESYLINIIRDPRDVVLSRRKTPWGSKRSAVFHAAEYVHYFKKNQLEGQKLFGNKYIKVQFEHLIESPKKEIKRVLDRLGLNFEEAVLDYSKNSSSLIANDEKAWKGNADKPILTENSNKWQSELDKGVVGLIESEIGSQMEELGYSLSGFKKNPLKVIEFKTVLAAFAFKSKREQLNG